MKDCVRNEVLHRDKDGRITYKKLREERLNGLITVSVGTAF